MISVDFKDSETAVRRYFLTIEYLHLVAKYKSSL